MPLSGEMENYVACKTKTKKNETDLGEAVSFAAALEPIPETHGEQKSRINAGQGLPPAAP